MNECMYDYAKEHRIHGEVKSIMLDSKVNMPYGKNYGFICTCITGSTKFPKYSSPFGHCRLTRLTLGPTTFARKSCLGVVSCIN